MSIAPSRAASVPRAALGQLVVAVILFGAAWPVTRWALIEGAAPSWFALGRAGLAALVATLVLASLGRLRRPIRADLPSLLAIGLLQLAGFFAFAHAAIAWIPAGPTALLANATLIFTVPLSLVMLPEPIPPARWGAVCLGAAGIVAMTGPWAVDWAAPHALLGHAYLEAAALCWAVAMLVVRRWPPRSTMFELLPWSFGLATFALLPLALAHDPGRWNGTAKLLMAAVGVVIAPLGTWCVMQATASLPLIVSSVGFLAGPVIGVVLATLLLHERLGPDLVAGAALILVAAGLASVSSKPA